MHENFEKKENNSAFILGDFLSPSLLPSDLLLEQHFPTEPKIKKSIYGIEKENQERKRKIYPAERRVAENSKETRKPSSKNNAKK